jgi:hypothetical protein
MSVMLESRTLSLSIACLPQELVDFVSNPENLPRWASGLCLSVRGSAAAGWIVETPYGPMPVRFVEKNSLGVLDHYVMTTPGVEVYVPMRVLPNGAGSELLFTLFRTPDMSEEKFAEDAGMVEQDLHALKKILEQQG